MIDPIFTSILAANLLNKIGDGKLTKTFQNLTERAEKAKQNLEQNGKSAINQLEEKRLNCINKVCDLQQEVVLCVTDSEFLKKILPLLLAHIGNIYEADSLPELRIIDMSLERIKNALEAYKSEKKRRKNIRLLAVIICIVALLGLGLFLFFSGELNINNDSLIPIIAIPASILIWSIIGSFTSILYRFTNAGIKELDNPLRWLFSRPLTGVVMGAISYLVIKVGLIAIEGPQNTNNVSNPEVLSLIAFLAGFSDRFSESLLKSAVGKFSSEKDGELISMEVSTKQTRETINEHSAMEVINQEKINKNSTSEDQLIVTKDGIKANPKDLGEEPKQSKIIETDEFKVSQTKESPENE